MKKLIFLVLFGITGMMVSGQSLFESALSGQGHEDQTGYQLSGQVTTDIFANETDFRSVYSRLKLDLETSLFDHGSGYAQIRFLKHHCGDDESSSHFDLREAYVNLFVADFDFRIGQQIIVWGRADGFNPTNNLTPLDYTIFSPEEDDRRLSNFVASGTWFFSPFSLNVNWVPVYRPAVLPLSRAQLPGGFVWGRNKLPDKNLKEGNWGLKFSYAGAKVDGSISWFSGYYKRPAVASDASVGEVRMQPFRTNILGMDFSTTSGKFGVRGECAWSIHDNGGVVNIPCNQLEYTFGLDREWGNFSLITQYIGKVVFDYEDNDLFSVDHLAFFNRIIFSQTEEVTHSVSLRPVFSLLHETLSLEMLTLFNCTVEEYFMKPMLQYQISDNVVITTGAQIYEGPENTLFDFMGDRVNAGFLELSVGF